MYRWLIASLICVVSLAQTKAPAPEPTASNMPANLPAQPIGPNDLLMVAVYDSPELSRSVRVGADGEIRIPMLKQRIKVEGLLPAGVEQKITTALVDEGILVDPVVTVGVAEYNSRPISVAGAVRTPMTFQAVGPMTLLQAISKAGGFDKNAGPEILLTSGTDTMRIPVKGLIEAADPRWNVALQGGEEIRVPETGRIFVVGNVKRPGAFSSPEVTDATVMKVIALSEGLMPFSAKQAFIYRPDATGAKQEIPIELSLIMQRKRPDVELRPEDVLYIPDNKGRRLSMAALERALLFGSTAGATALIYGSR